MDHVPIAAAKALDLPITIQTIIGAAILGIAYWLITGGQQPVAGIPIVEPSDVLKTKKTWQKGVPPFIGHAAEIMEKGRRLVNNKGVYQVKAGAGWKVMLPNTFAHELRNHKDLDFIESMKRDFHSNLPGFDGLREAFREDHIIPDVVRVRLTQSLALITDDVVDEADHAIDLWLGNNKQWQSIPLRGSLLDIVARISSRVFCGVELARDEEWLKIAKDYTLSIFTSAQELHKWPAFLRPFAAWFILPCCKNLRSEVVKARQVIAPTIDKRLKQREESKSAKTADVFHWLLDVQNGRPIDFVAGQLTLSIAAIHTTTEMVSRCILQICETPEIVDALRQEIVQVLQEDGWAKTSLAKMKLLDSFVKECMRFHRMGIASMNRVTTKPLTLSNGIRIPKGVYVMVEDTGPRDPSIYPSPETFDMYRYYKWRQQPGEENKHQFVTTSPDNMGFGHGEHACPGRFFASNEIKILFCFLLIRYDFRYVPGEKMPALIPFEVLLNVDGNARVQVRRREAEEIDLVSPKA